MKRILWITGMVIAALAMFRSDGQAIRACPDDQCASVSICEASCEWCSNEPVEWGPAVCWNDNVY